jgi:hypothetical protein
MNAARAWLAANANEFYAHHALIGLTALLNHSGRIPRVVDLRWMQPEEKAHAALSRLNRASVKPERLLEIHLGVSAAIEEDPYAPHGDLGEFRKVQVAKAAHRLASGYHAIYGPNTRYDKYPRSSGRVLRALGDMIERSCELVTHYHLPDVLNLKTKQYGARALPAGRHEFPRSRFGNSRIAPPPSSRVAVPSGRSDSTVGDERSSRFERRLKDEAFRHGFGAFDGKF